MVAAPTPAAGRRCLAVPARCARPRCPSTTKLVAACAELAVTTLDTPLAAMGYALATMAQQWQMLHEEIEEHWEHLQRLTKQTAPALTDACGIGPDTAAQLLITFGDHGDRVRSEAGFAKLCGVSPMPTSSGKTQRHRLNRGGNRQANTALFRVAGISRPRSSLDARLKDCPSERLFAASKDVLLEGCIASSDQHSQIQKSP